MQVMVGLSDRYGKGDNPPVHLVLNVAGRLVLSCTGGAASGVHEVAFEDVLGELGCSRCAGFWRKVMVQPSST